MPKMRILGSEPSHVHHCPNLVSFVCPCSITEKNLQKGQNPKLSPTKCSMPKAELELRFGRINVGTIQMTNMVHSFTERKKSTKIYCITEIWCCYLPYVWLYNGRKICSYLPIWMNGTHRRNGMFLERNFFTARWSAWTDFLISGTRVGIPSGPLNTSL